MNRNLITLLVLLSVTSFTYAQQPSGSGNPGVRPDPIGVIKGKILDEKTGEALPYTNVILYNQGDSSLVTGTISSADGSFVIEKVPIGHYYMEVKFIGYEKHTVNDVNVLPQKSSLDMGVIKISPSSQQLKEVEVTAAKPPVEFQIDKKVVNITENMSNMGNSLARALENVPSITVDIDGNVALRGSSNFQVLIDGKPSPLSGSDALQQIPASAVQNVEIITNPSAKYDPDGLGGIINIITKKKALNGISGVVNMSLGTHEKYRGDATLTYKSDKVTAYLGGNFMDEHETGSLQRSSITYMPDTTKYILSNGTGERYRQGFSVKGGVTLTPTKGNSFSLEGQVGSHGFHRIESGNYHEYSMPSFTDLYYINNSKGGHSENFVNVTGTYDKSFGAPNHKLTTYLQYEHSPGKNEDSQQEIFTDENFQEINVLPYMVQTPQTSNENNWRFQSDYVQPMGTKGKLEAGYQMKINRENSDYHFLEYDNLQNAYVENPLFKDAMNFRRDIHALYTTYSNEYGKFGYELGLRGEYTYRSVQNLKSDTASIINRLDLFPTLHTSMKVGKQDQVMASYSRRINRPRGWNLDPFPQYIDPNTTRIGNPGLLPEYVDSYETSYQKGLGKSFVSLEGYYRITHNGITRIMEVQPDGKRLFTTTNLNKEKAMGFEAMINFQLTKWFNLNASGDLYRYTLQGNVSDTTVAAQSTNSNVRFNGDFKITPTTRFQIQGYYQGPSVTAQGRRQQFFVTNASLRQDFFKNKLSAILAIRDIFGTAKFQFISQGSDFQDQFKFEREHQIVTLTLGYRINNYKNKGRGNNEGEQPSNEGGGMMMDN